jgi:hypothetical protein
VLEGEKKYQRDEKSSCLQRESSRMTNSPSGRSLLRSIRVVVVIVSTVVSTVVVSCIVKGLAVFHENTSGLRRRRK